MNRHSLILAGRRTGLKALTKRLSELDAIAKEKKVQFGWDNRGTYYDVYIEDENHNKVYEETVLTKGIPTIQKVNVFHDIIENELKKR